MDEIVAVENLEKFQVIEASQLITIPTHTWVWITSTGIEVLQTSGASGTLFMRPNGELVTNWPEKWHFRTHKED